MTLAGKSVIVTGGASGIGAASAKIIASRVGQRGGGERQSSDGEGGRLGDRGGGRHRSIPEDGPYGLRGCGEVPIIPPIGAIANAIANATGVRITDLLFKPERVFWALREAGKV